MIANRMFAGVDVHQMSTATFLAVVGGILHIR